MCRFRLLIITQVLDPDHPILGFFYKWVFEMAKLIERIHVITYHSSGRPANNVLVYTTSKKRSIPRDTKSKFKGRARRLISLLIMTFKVNLLMLKAVKMGGFDVILCHMNPEFVLASWPLAKLLRKPIAFWYLHKGRSLRLILAYKLADRIFTGHRSGAPAGPKTKVLSHGIEIPDKLSSLSKPIILYVGRVSKSKRVDILIDGFKKAKNLLPSEISRIIKLRIIGPIDFEYSRLDASEGIELVGPIPHKKIWNEYLNSMIFVSASTTGLDKSVLEAMASGLPVLVSDEIYRETLEDLFEICSFKNSNDLAQKISMLIINRELREKIGKACRDKVLKYHSIEKFIPKLVSELKLMRLSSQVLE